MKTKLTIGADPELFLIDRDGKFIASCGKFGGTKRNPRPIGEGCHLQEDNVALEFNIPPADQVDKFINSLHYALNDAAKRAADHGLSLSITASHSFTKDQLASSAARVFGCEPDFNAWTENVNPPPKAMDPDLRSCGGHVHFGTPLNKVHIVRWADVVMGLFSVREDPDQRRRMLYGKAGAFRPKMYGVEYRTLSNYWLKTTEMMEKVWARANYAVEMVEKGMLLDEKDGEAIQWAINNSSGAKAEELIKKYGVEHLA